ncbi:hypothetical protein [Bradyrhizobium sp.]|uniref:hypothetical protein n=1 Tax=Bradyrhizobium sp. TaxID=376 RepID=UPI003C74F0E6
MLVGDVPAYIDIYSAVFLLSILSRAATILFIVKQAAARATRLAGSLLAGMRRLDFRHRREREFLHISRSALLRMRIS